jgi:hypothetical protein
MKKLMMVAAAAALTASVQAGIVVTNCKEKVSTECPNIVFKVTASGKIVDGISKEYKTVSKLKISKGALVLWGAGSDDSCCYDYYSLYLPLKLGKTTYKIVIPQEEMECWTIFGKNLDKAMEDYEKNKKFKLDSEIGLSYADDAAEMETLEDIEVDFIATAVGSASYLYTAEAQKKSACTTGCVPASYDVVPGSYSGWFAGFYPAEGDELCLTCACNELDVYGGTWKAKYDKAKSVKAGWIKAAQYAFGSTTAALMVAEEIE